MAISPLIWLIRLTNQDSYKRFPNKAHGQSAKKSNAFLKKMEFD